MCLMLGMYHQVDLKNYKKRFKNGKIVVWKKLDQIMSCVGKKTSLEYYSPHQDMKWKNGLNKSDRLHKNLTKYETIYGDVHHGFHVYTSRNEARKHWRGTKLVKMIGKIQDLVAVSCNSKEAVFTRLYFDKNQRLRG